MRSPRNVLVSSFIAVAFTSLTACGYRASGEVRMTVRTPVKQETPQPKKVVSATDKAERVAALQWIHAVALYVAATQVQVQPTPTPDPEPPVIVPQSEVTGVAATSSMPCGGSEYPPCYVAQRESGNTYDAFNPTGCGGNACYGRWQFSGAWAGKLGLPSDLSQATPEQQDNAARELWAGGAGCSHWAACS